MKTYLFEVSNGKKLCDKIEVKVEKPWCCHDEKDADVVERVMLNHADMEARDIFMKKHRNQHTFTVKLIGVK